MSLSEQLQSLSSDLNQQLKQHMNTVNHFKGEQELKEQQRKQREQVLENELKVQIKEMLKQSQEDIQTTGQLVENSQKKVLNEVGKRLSTLQADITGQVQADIDQCVKAIKEWTERSLEDKVRVDEVQDALKKITDSFHSKLQAIQENSQ